MHRRGFDKGMGYSGRYIKTKMRNMMLGTAKAQTHESRRREAASPISSKRDLEFRGPPVARFG